MPPPPPPFSAAPASLELLLEPPSCWALQPLAIMSTSGDQSLAEVGGPSVGQKGPLLQGWPSTVAAACMQCCVDVPEVAAALARPPPLLQAAGERLAAEGAHIMKVSLRGLGSEWMGRCGCSRRSAVIGRRSADGARLPRQAAVAQRIYAVQLLL